MLVWLDRPQITAGVQDQRGAHRRGFENARRDVPNVELRFDRVSINAKLRVGHRAAANCSKPVMGGFDRTVKIEYIRAGFRPEIGAARANEIVPGFTVNAFVVGPFDIVWDAASDADFAHA